MHLVMLETNGNQRFVFSSPRQRENIGASYLLTRLAPWARQEADKQGIEVTPVSESSGKVIAVVDGQDDARALISAVTARALAQAPGMDVSGVFIPVENADVTEEDLSHVHAEAARYGLNRPPAEARFPQTPYLRRAQDSALPAAPFLGLERKRRDSERPWSLTSQVKRACAADARRRLLKIAQNDPRFESIKERLARDLQQLEDAFDCDTAPPEAAHQGRAQPQSAHRLSKIAVVHIDGNGVGAMMSRLGESMRAIPRRDFIAQVHCEPQSPRALRLFLLKINKSLDTAVTTAFLTAWAKVAQWADAESERTGRPPAAVPVVPILLGGDDATVLTEGRYALPFMDAFLQAYEEATEKDPLLGHLSPRARQNRTPAPMTAAAGAAIVPRAFPFHLAYNLAEELVRDAKRIGKEPGQECSTLTYHALFDSTITDPHQLLEGYQDFTARPYRLHAPTAGPPTGGHAPAAEPTRGERTAASPLRGAPWPTMIDRSTWFTGLSTAPGAKEPVAFPKTRAARIRKLLSDQAHTPPGAEPVTPQDIDSEWQDARRVLGPMVTALGDAALVFDLIELSELLPIPYLEQSAKQPPTAPAPDTTTHAQEDQ